MRRKVPASIVKSGIYNDHFFYAVNYSSIIRIVEDLKVAFFGKLLSQNLVSQEVWLRFERDV